LGSNRKSESGRRKPRKEADHFRRESFENRKQDMHRIDVLLAEAKLDHQLMQNIMLRFDNADALCEEEDENTPISAQQAA
jgi:hypothetical protein